MISSANHSVSEGGLYSCSCYRAQEKGPGKCIASPSNALCLYEGKENCPLLRAYRNRIEQIAIWMLSELECRRGSESGLSEAAS